jgi:hypothetical protein
VGGPFNLITHFCLSIYSENARHFLAIIKPDLTRYAAYPRFPWSPEHSTHRKIHRDQSGAV